MKASDLLVKALENEGVQYIFGIPGEENLDFLNSLRKSTQIKLILTRHEQAAGFMAATYGRLTGEPGVAMSTLGPGATNLMTAAAFANLGAMPMFMLTGQKPIKSNKQGQFQILNVVDMMQPVTKFTKQVVNANSIPYQIRQAFRIAREERPGATHLELPEDIAAEEVETVHILPKRNFRLPIADQKILAQTVEQIRAAKDPLIMVAAGANRTRTAEAILKFVEKTKIPFFSTQMGKGVVDERHEQYLGNAALSSGDYLHKAIDHADLIINIGHDVVEKPPFRMEKDGRIVIHINYYSADIDELYFPQYELIGDIASNIEQLTNRLEPCDNWDFTYFYEVQKTVAKKTSEKQNSQQFPIIPQYLVHTVRQSLPEDGILTLDNGMYKLWFARNYECYQPNTILLDNALASMGAGLPAGIAAKLVHPERKVVAICGDGGFMMNSQELETAVRLDLDLVIIIVNDKGLGMIKWKQDKMDFPDYGLSYKNPDLVQYANSYGAKGHLVKSAEQFSELLQQCLESKGVHLIDLPIDYSENKEVFNI